MNFSLRTKLCLPLVVLATVVSALSFTPVAGRHGMVASSEPLASELGVQILREGGNAVDAAVAVGFALAVTHPVAGNIGGGGFMLIRLASGEAVVVDYREAAPTAASRNMYVDSHGELIPRASTVGALSAGVPGTVAGLALAEEKYGKLGLARVIAPAVHLARDGFVVSYSLSESLRQDGDRLSKFDASRRIFLRDGRYYEPGEIFQQPELAETLDTVAHLGAKGFYEGPVARAIAATMQKYHGLITEQDLARYHPVLRQPLVGHFRGYEILSVPPPSSGGVALIEMLNIIEPLDLGVPDSFESMHFMVEAMRHAYADRAAYLGDADFVSVPVARLTSQAYAAKLRDEILHSKPDAPIVAGDPQAFESAQTTHYSVVDDDGNAVANTYTLNNGYGSGVTVEGAGFLLNDEMDDFAAKPGSPNLYGLVQGEANAIAPNKRPLSSMTPTVVLQGGRLRLVLGSPGGGTIINTVLEVLLDNLIFKMDILQAVSFPRFHHQWMPDRLILERVGFSADTIQKLRDAGYQVDVRGWMGDCEAIEIDPHSGWKFGAADPRAGGKAVGY
ncbi:MAG: gamma-glutamyltransferase [Terriglobia bacterium]|jgi:gamma-glutamyltranspeptidase/glutathione hydrolase